MSDSRSLAAALRMMEDREYVVIGFPPKCCDVEQGDVIYQFANQSIPGYELVIAKPTKRADWDAQAKAISKFDPTIRNPTRERGQKFFRCILAPLPAALQSTETEGQTKDGAQA